LIFLLFPLSLSLSASPFFLSPLQVSVNDLIIRSAALALRDVPEMNASFDPTSNKPKLNPTVSSRSSEQRN
jgi:hypothetical protein